MRSLKGYMVFDLIVLTIIGCLLEGFGAKCCGDIFTSAPTITLSFLILYIAIARWNLWGLVIVPFLALANKIGGGMINFSFIKAVYDWKLYISVILGMLTMGANVIIFKRYSSKRISSEIATLVGILVLDYLLYTVVQWTSYRLLTSGDLLEGGVKIFEYIKYNKDGTSNWVKTNIYGFGEGGFVYNLFAFISAMIGCIVLRSQAVISNVKEKLIDDRRNAELNRINTENFTINEAISDEQSSENSI